MVQKYIRIVQIVAKKIEKENNHMKDHLPGNSNPYVYGFVYLGYLVYLGITGSGVFQLRHFEWVTKYMVSKEIM